MHISLHLRRGERERRWTESGSKCLELFGRSRRWVFDGKSHRWPASHIFNILGNSLDFSRCADEVEMVFKRFRESAAAPKHEHFHFAEAKPLTCAAADGGGASSLLISRPAVELLSFLQFFSANTLRRANRRAKCDV